MKTILNLRDYLDVPRSAGQLHVIDARVDPYLEWWQQPARLTELPMLTSWHSDGGAFVTLPLVYTEHPDGHGQLPFAPVY